MLRTLVITDDQLATFERDGYLVVRSGFSAAEMALIARWTDELAAMPEVSGRHWVFHEKSLKGDGRDLINRIENIAPFHDGFAEFAEALRVPVGQLLGEEATLFKEKVNFKMPGGGGFKPHQDSQAGWDAYAASAAACGDADAVAGAASASSDAASGDAACADAASGRDACADAGETASDRCGAW